MPRKPNYRFERMERQRAKAAKKAARHEAKKEKAEKRHAEQAGPELSEDGASGATEEPQAEAQEDGALRSDD